MFNKFNKLGIVGKSPPSGILQWKTFWKKEELHLKMKVFDFFM